MSETQPLFEKFSLPLFFFGSLPEPCTVSQFSASNLPRPLGSGRTALTAFFKGVSTIFSTGFLARPNSAVTSLVLSSHTVASSSARVASSFAGVASSFASVASSFAGVASSFAGVASSFVSVVSSEIAVVS